MELDRIRDAAERVARSEGLAVLDIEWKVGKQRFLRVYLDRPPSEAEPQGGKISHQDCQRVSEQLSVILDVEELVPGSNYVLEVSSPGLDRKLIHAEDYQRFAGRLAKIWLSEPVEGSAYYEGRIRGIENGVVKLALDGSKGKHESGRELDFPFANIRKANLKIEV
jgi:ribosome maturation factor RimP